MRKIKGLFYNNIPCFQVSVMAQYRPMADLLMITFRCQWELFERLEKFAIERNIDRTSAIKLALHYFLNLRDTEPPAEGKKALPIHKD